MCSADPQPLGRRQSHRRGEFGDILRMIINETQHKYAIDEDHSESIEEAPDNDEELQAWCLSEEGANPHIRNIRDGAMIMLDVQFFSWQGQKVVKPLSTQACELDSSVFK